MITIASNAKVASRS